MSSSATASAAASNDDVTSRFHCPITLELMNDPVRTVDGQVYDRPSILEWFKNVRTHGRLLTSPLTNIRLRSDALTPVPELLNEIQAFNMARNDRIQPDDVKFTISSDLFKEFDKLPSLLAGLNLPNPQIIVIGNESHGKSSLLERIIGLPIFPRDKDLCTRCLIRVQLRRCAAGEVHIAEVSTQPVQVSSAPVTAAAVNAAAGTKFLQQSQSIPSPQHQRNGLLNNMHNINNVTAPPSLPASPSQVTFTALDSIRKVIKQKMDEMRRASPNAEIIIDREIVVKIRLPHCLNLDLLDLPGLVTTNPSTAKGQDVPAATRELAMRVIEQYKGSSIFLLVNDCRVPPNQSRGCEIIQQAKLQENTFGIFTKIDMFQSEDGDEQQEMRELMSCSRSSSFKLPLGWLATTNKRSIPGVSATASELSQLQAIDRFEANLIATKYPTLQASHKLGIAHVRQMVQLQYERFLVNQWLPHIEKSLKDLSDAAVDSIRALGTPLAKSAAYATFAIEDLRNVTVQDVQSSVGQRVQRCLKERVQWSPVFSDKLWAAVKKCVVLIEPSLSSQYGSNFNAHQLSQFMDSRSSHQYVQNERTTIVAFSLAQDAIETKETSILSELRCVFESLQISDQDKSSFMKLFNEDSADSTVTKMARFPLLQQHLQQLVNQTFDQINSDFQAWFEDFIKDIRKPGNLVSFEYYSPDSNRKTNPRDVQCGYGWANKKVLWQYPHIIINQWNQIFSAKFAALDVIANFPANCIEGETCEAARIALFQEYKKLQATQTTLRELSLKVSSAARK